MNSKSNLSHKGFTPHIKNLCVGFTLVEMLIVIGIFAVLVAVVVSILNPTEFFKQTRDSRRMVDLQSLNKALNFAEFDNVSMGTSSVVYVSIPDSSATCANLALPACLELPEGWSCACSTQANYRKPNGTGWVPVDFTSLVTVPSALTVLPIDPINSTSTSLYYTYVKGSWELTALFETTSYQTKYASIDNGASTVLYELGRNLKITPDAIASRTNTTGGGGPTITTNAATNVAATTATLNGSLTNEGGASSTITGFDYGLTTSYGSQATSTYSGGTGSFSNNITGLTASTLYNFRAKAKNSAGWGHGSNQTLTTSAPPWALNQTTCDALSGWYWYTTNGRNACWSKTLADGVRWNKGVSEDSDVTGTYTCTSLGTYDLQTRMQAAAAGEWFKIVSVVDSITITSSHNGQPGVISALAISDCMDGTKDLVDCVGCSSWSLTNTWLRNWAGASGKSALPYLSTDAGTTQATNDYWDACTQNSGQDTPLGSTNLFYLNRKVSDDGDTNNSWAAACGGSDGVSWGTHARRLGYSSCSDQNYYGTGGIDGFLSFRVVVRP